jgi:hypothetical protein
MIGIFINHCIVLALERNIVILFIIRTKPLSMLDGYLMKGVERWESTYQPEGILLNKQLMDSVQGI